METQERSPAKTVSELGYQFDGFVRLMDERQRNIDAQNVEIKEALVALAKSLDAANSSKADKSDVLRIERDLDEFKKEYKGDRDKVVTKTEFKVGLGTITVILSIVVTVLNIWTRFN